MILMVVRQEFWTALAVAKSAEMRVGKLLSAAKGPVKNWHSNSFKKTNLLFLRGWWRRRCCRWCGWWWNENKCVIELCVSNPCYWGILFWYLVYVALPSYQQRNVWEGQEIEGQYDTYWRSQVGFSFQLDLHTVKMGFTKPIQLFCDRGRCIKPIFYLQPYSYLLIFL